MTGVSDIYRSARTAAHFATVWWLSFLCILPAPLAVWLRQQKWIRFVIADEDLHCPPPSFPDPRPTMAAMAASTQPLRSLNGPGQGGVNALHPLRSRLRPCIPSPAAQWALLLPITSWGCSGEESFWARLESTLNQLVWSIPPADRQRTCIYLAHDLKDPVLDSRRARNRIRAAMNDELRVCFLTPLPPAYEGKLGWIWDHMAQAAVAQGADFFILLGDDVALETRGWQREVEDEFADVSRRRNLPFGAACVAMQDRSFPAFPTFPVVHRFHLDTFGTMFPPEFLNQHGDPFLFEIYRRFGAARFTPSASVTNAVGGSGIARYAKHSRAPWRGELLTVAVEKLAANLPAEATRVSCLDVVVPTFRCDVEMLRALASMSVAGDAHLHTLIVVDRPSASNVAAIQLLTSYAHGRVVRVHVMPENGGAAVARNVGLAQSFGDNCVLLDDDVIPQPGLLDAYLGAITRRPDAVGFVGMAKMNEAHTIVEHAVLACRITFFYGISARVKEPPWGVTANLCVRSRTLPLFFDPRFPKTGGGEDVDFCFRLRQSGTLVSVPNAAVVHPFWSSPLSQVAGWASGDVLCLDAHPNITFWTLPNWAEVALLCLIAGAFCLVAGYDGHTAFYGHAAMSVLCEAVLLFLSYAPETAAELPLHSRALIGLYATLLPMTQDIVRLGSKLRRGRWSQLCLRFDWMDGKGDADHVPATQLAILIKLALYFLASTSLSLLCQGLLVRGVVGCVLLFAGLGLWAVGQRHVWRLRRGQPARLAASMAMQPGPTRFVIFAAQRTGSNLLCGLLHHVPAISMHSELFARKGVHTHCGGINRSVEAREADPGKLLRDAFSVRKRPGAVGFKLFPDHMVGVSVAQQELCMQVLLDPHVKKIFLQRKNRLAMAVSVVRAQVTGAYIHTAAVGQATVDLQVTLLPSELERFCDSYDAYYRFLERAIFGQRALRLTYEELLENQEAAVAGVCSFLGVPRGDAILHTVFVKQTKRAALDSRDVSNWEELVTAFHGTQNAWVPA